MATKHHDWVNAQREYPDRGRFSRYSNVIPIFVSVRQIDRQGRRTPSRITSKPAGMPYVVDTWRQAPVSETFRTAQSSFGALSLRTICAFLSTRLRWMVLLSGTARRLGS